MHKKISAAHLQQLANARAISVRNNTGRKLSPEHVAKLKAAVRPPITPEAIAKMSASKKGYVFSAEHRRRISEKAKLRVFTPEYRKNMSDAAKRHIAANGHRITEEIRLKGMAARRITPEQHLMKRVIRFAMHRIGLRRWPYKRISACLGYTCDDLCRHLEKQFKDGMSWANYGEWHVDHVYPVARFVRDGVSDPAVVNALSNLQPLWKMDNHRKSAKVA